MKSRFLHEAEDKELDIVPIILNPDPSEPVLTRTQTTTITTTECVDADGNSSSSTKKWSKTTTLNTLNKYCTMDCDVGEDE